MKKLKKVTAVLLSILMLISCLAVFGYAEGEAEYVQDIPHIDMRGFMNASIYEDKNDDTSKCLWPLSGSDIFKQVVSLVPALTKYKLTRNSDDLADAVTGAVNNLFSPLMCDDNGEPIAKNSGAYCPLPTAADLEKSLDISFMYDWRVSPIESAARLNELICYLTEDMGYSQVVLEGHSNGNVILFTYFALYGTNKVKSCCMSAPAVYGASFGESLITGELQIDKEGLAEYLKGVLSGSINEKIAEFFINSLTKSGILGRLVDKINDIIIKIHDKLYCDSIIPIFGRWANVWSMAPDESLEQGLEYCFNTMNKNNADYTALKQKINAYLTDVGNRRDEVLEQINNDCNFYVFCMYGYTGIPVSDTWREMSDGVLRCADSSMGASFYSILDDNVFEQGKYVSPNGKVNASTAKFKDNTWFFNNCKHAFKCDSLDEMAKVLLYADKQATIDTFAQYPAFMTGNGEAVTAEK